MLRKTTAFLLTSNFLSGVLAVVVLGLIGHNLAYVHTNQAQHGSTLIVANDTLPNGTEVQMQYTMAYLPEDLRLDSYYFMLVMAVLVTVGSLFIGLLLAHRRSKTLERYYYGNSEVPPRMRSSAILLLSIATINFLLAAASTIYSFIVWQRSGTLDPSMDTSATNGRYPSANGTWFTPDAWNCQLEDYIPNDATQDQVDDMCNEGTTARSLPLAMAVLGLIVLVTAIMKLRKEKDEIIKAGRASKLRVSRLSGDTLPGEKEAANAGITGVSARVRRELGTEPKVMDNLHASEAQTRAYGGVAARSEGPATEKA